MRSLECSPGKRHSHKLKKQKRVLCDTLHNFHARFRNTQTMCTVSYPSFCRMRLFWVVSPNQSDRDTCLRLTHENMALLLAKLNELKVIHTKRSTAILEMVAHKYKSVIMLTGRHRRRGRFGKVSKKIVRYVARRRR